MIRRGNVRNPDRYRQVKIYQQAHLMECTQKLRRSISPTDIDGVIECNNRFVFVEYKPSGAPVDGGQRTMYRRLINMMRGSGMLAICEHPEQLDVIDVPADIERVSFVTYGNGGNVDVEGPYSSGSLPRRIDEFLCD